MAELEIHHHEEGHGNDPLGKKVGILVAIFAVCVALVTIKAHRSHTESVMTKAEENDTWAYYQAKSIKMNVNELGRNMVTLAAPKNEESAKVIETYSKSIEKYKEETEDLKKEGNALKEKVKVIEAHALFFDLGEGLLEIALVMSSLYFIAKKSIFPIMGTLAGLAGAAIAIYGLIS